MSGSLVYDTGALIAAERGNGTMWRIHRMVLEAGFRPVVIAPVLAQAWRGSSKQALLGRFLSGCSLEHFPVRLAFDVGRLLAAARTKDTTDAAVVLRAVKTRDVLVTRDPRDLHHLGDTLGYPLDMKVI